MTASNDTEPTAGKSASSSGKAAATRRQAPEPPGAYPGHELFLPYLINKATTLLNVPVQRMLDQEGLTLTHWRVLAFLSARDGLTVGALADATMTEQSTLSRSLRTLETLGYVARQASDVDSRAVHIHLNDAGHVAFQRMLDKALAIEAAILGGVSDADLAIFRSVLQRIIVSAR